jgi:hypothetical protein
MMMRWSNSNDSSIRSRRSREMALFHRHRYRRALILAVVSLALSTLACITIDTHSGGGPLPTPEPTATLSSDPLRVPVQVSVDVQYYSKVPTAFYHLLGKTSKQQSFATFALANQGAGQVTVKVKSEIEGFTEQAVDTVVLAPGQSARVEQTPIMKSGAREQLNEGRVAAFHYWVTYVQDGGEGSIDERSINVDLMSKRDLVVAIVDDQGDLLADFREYVVAWVTPSSPAVEQLLREATEYLPDEAIYGYQKGPEGVLPQLAAVYQVINDAHRIRYVNTPVSLAKTDRTYVQRIRLPAETIQQQAGNCIETAVLYASIIEAMDMNPLLVLVPGHAFVACELAPGSKQYVFIETTVLGEGLTFTDALGIGQENWIEYQSQTMLIDVHHWRTEGILPMPEE